ncbi:hypothetical protein BGX27_003696, partial [Mortierella sp. AM989]
SEAVAKEFSITITPTPVIGSPVPQPTGGSPDPSGQTPSPNNGGKDKDSAAGHALPQVLVTVALIATSLTALLA